MKRTESPRLIFLSVLLLASMPALAQPAARTDLLESDRTTPVNRTVTHLAGGPTGVRLDQRPGDGMLWLEGVDFSQGTVEFDVRGRDLLQQSFVGLAFHGQDDKTYEAVYFRPFNFRATDPVRRVHAVQYVALPGHPWQKLRTEHPDHYEAALSPAPDPDDWFHVRVEVAGGQVSIFVNGAASPALSVERLGPWTGGRLGLWVGNNSGGDFANLTIRTN